jgi:hypothetical protein
MLASVTIRLFVAVLLGVLAASAMPQDANLAKVAKASASEFQPGLPPELANDGSESTRWSGIPGHNSGVWYQLDLPKSATIAEVLIRQYDRFSMEWDVQVRDGGSWRTVQHFGEPGKRLPINVLCTFPAPIETDGIRIANITNGPSFTEVELYGAGSRHLPALEMASDLRGNFVGMLCDGLGTQPMPGQPIHMSGQAAGRTWLASATTDQHGMFFVLFKQPPCPRACFRAPPSDFLLVLGAQWFRPSSRHNSDALAVLPCAS